MSKECDEGVTCTPLQFSSDFEVRQNRVKEKIELMKWLLDLSSTDFLH